MAERVVVVGADAAGMSAASQALRLGRQHGRDIDMVVLERGTYTSYSACGIPYWVGGDVGSVDDLIARTPEQHRANGVDLRLRSEAMALDVDRRGVEVRDHEKGETYRLGFDQLVVATGARPRRPDVPGVDAAGIHGVQTLGDGEALLTHLSGVLERSPRRAVVVGGGYIGIEMAEAMVNRGLEVTVLTRSAEPMATLDPDMGRLVHTAMEAMGIDVRTEVRLDGFEADEAGLVRAVATGDGAFAADLVVLGTGVAPETTLARAAGLTIGRWGGVLTDLQMRVFDAEGIWAAGDCVESIDLVSGNRVHVALGTHANKQGRVLGTNLGGGYATFPGVVGTAVSKVCDLEIARTGLREADCDAVGYRWLTVTVESTTRAGYYPDASPITVKLVVERRTGRLLGGQIVGREGAAKRIDALAVALWNRMTVEEIAMLDLGYAPPFSPVWDPVLIAACKAADAVRDG
jgi:NADPH-dependent 2,4-dienoyl-CoA reductase/sulfur reductase-like enzyme